jgi:hypothetical protein
MIDEMGEIEIDGFQRRRAGILISPDVRIERR